MVAARRLVAPGQHRARGSARSPTRARPGSPHTPAPAASTARMARGTVMTGGDSWTWCATSWSTRDRPRNVEEDEPPHVEGGQRRARPGRARRSRASRRRTRRRGSRPSRRSPRTAGGPEIATVAISIVYQVTGSFRARPPIFRRSCSPESAWMTEPAPEEQERLEERVGHQVVDARGVRADADADEHVAQLAHRRVGQHALDVGLDEPDRRGEDRGQHPDPGDHVEGDARPLEERVGARDEVDAGRHHGRRVDQGRDRRRALHGVREPRVERQLRRLPARPHEEEQADRGGRPDGQGRRLREHLARTRASPASSRAA